MSYKNKQSKAIIKKKKLNRELKNKQKSWFVFFLIALHQIPARYFFLLFVFITIDC
jgi:hypothetical protein